MYENLESFKREKENGFKEEVLAIIKKETNERLKDVSEYHGQEHTQIVVENAKLLALGEGSDPFNAEIAGWAHDWGRVSEKTDEKRRKHAELSYEDSRKFFRQLWEEGKLTTKQFRYIEEGVLFHSDRRETQFENLKIIRDADRLSRFGSVGLYHLLSGGREEGLPLYLEGRPIIRPDDAPIMDFKEIKCIIDDMNACLDWVKMMETDSAKTLVNKLKETNNAFLVLFSQHQDLNDLDLWLAFVKELSNNFKQKKAEFAVAYQWKNSPEDFTNWLKFYEDAEDPKIFSEENFQKFLKEYEKKES